MASLHLAITVLLFIFCHGQLPTVATIRLDGSKASLDLLMQHYLRQAQQHNARKLLSEHNSSRKPNFLVIMTDDQDLLLNSTHPAYMPEVQNSITKQGIWFRSFTVSSTVCCPSRVNFLTGMFTHNHNVTSNVGNDGGYVKFKTEGLDKSYLPSWLQDNGYRTYFAGKFLNGFLHKSQRLRCPPGWTVFEPSIKPHVLDFWHPAFTTNCETEHEYPGQYATDVLLNKTLHYMMDAARHPDQPFFITAMPIAPHEGCGRDETSQADGDSCSLPPEPAPRHMDLYNDVDLPKSRNYGVAPPDGTYIQVDIGKRTWNEEAMRRLYLQRLRSLRSVDELLGSAIQLLKQTGQLDNTYIIFMSDNGFKIGNHGVTKGKLTAYEEDVRVPFYIRGPGISQGFITDYPATMCDVPATIVDLAGLQQPSFIDGTPIPFNKIIVPPKHIISTTSSQTTTGRKLLQSSQQQQESYVRDVVPHEMWVWGSDPRLTQRDYRAIRLCTPHLEFGTPSEYLTAAMSPGATFGFRMAAAVPVDNAEVDPGDLPITCYKYVLWCTGVRELYDLMLDPGETVNRYTSASNRFLSRLEAYLNIQAICKGKDCHKPYQVLHPSGDVSSFRQTMDPQFDPIYTALPKYRFTDCTLHYLKANEFSWFSYPAPPPDEEFVLDLSTNRTSLQPPPPPPLVQSTSNKDGLAVQAGNVTLHSPSAHNTGSKDGLAPTPVPASPSIVIFTSAYPPSSSSPQNKSALQSPPSPPPSLQVLPGPPPAPAPRPALMPQPGTMRMSPDSLVVFMQQPPTPGASQVSPPVSSWTNVSPSRPSPSHTPGKDNVAAIPSPTTGTSVASSPSVLLFDSDHGLTQTPSVKPDANAQPITPKDSEISTSPPAPTPALLPPPSSVPSPSPSPMWSSPTKAPPTNPLILLVEPGLVSKDPNAAKPSTSPASSPPDHDMTGAPNVIIFRDPAGGAVEDTPKSSPTRFMFAPPSSAPQPDQQPIFMKVPLGTGGGPAQKSSSPTDVIVTPAPAPDDVIDTGTNDAGRTNQSPGFSGAPPTLKSTPPTNAKDENFGQLQAQNSNNNSHRISPVAPSRGAAPVSSFDIILQDGSDPQAPVVPSIASSLQPPSLLPDSVTAPTSQVKSTPSQSPRTAAAPPQSGGDGSIVIFAGNGAET